MQRGLVDPDAPGLAARWMLKQVQHDEFWIAGLRS
jgi:hypothetical protein